MATQSAPVLVTRPQVEAEAFAEALVSRFGARVRPVVAPLLSPRNLNPVLPQRDYAAVVFTSAQAVESSRALWPRLPRLAWCVGRKTAQAAAAAGFDARSADGDAKALMSALSANPPSGNTLYLRGVDTSLNLLEEVRKLGISADELVVYVQEQRPLSPMAIKLLQQPDAVVLPLFSPRTARLFRSALPSDCRAQLHVAAMSESVASALDGLPCAGLSIARHPDAAAMLDVVESLLADLTLP